MKRPEQQLQMAVAAYLRLALKPPTIWTAFPAGGGGRTRGAFLKAMGLQAGWPDILIIDRGPNVIGIELKAKTGTHTPAQKMIARAFHDVQAFYCVARSIDEVEDCLRGASVPLYAKA